jgi:tetratricopeptide (TPR) repeat protein
MKRTRAVAALLSGLLLVPAAAALRADAPKQEAAGKPPWQRLLQGEDVRQAKELEERLGKALEAGQWKDALQAAEALARLRERAQGKDHWEAVSARWEAEAVRRVLRQGPEGRADFARLTALDRQGEALEAKGRYREAQPLYQQALDIRRKVLGEDHADTASSYNNVAYNLNAQGQYAQAQPLYQKALEIRRKVLGEDHPDTAQSYNNVAYNLDSQGRYAQAQPLYQKALDIWRKVLGEEHPDTAAGYNNVAGNLDHQGQYAQAQPLYQRALDICRKALGEEHPDTARGYNNVAANLYDQGKYAEAQPLYQKALDIRRKALGRDHPDTAQSYDNVAVNLLAQGKSAEAQPLYQRALDIYRKVLGEDHPDTAIAYNNVAANLQAQGRYAEAQPLLQKALDIDRNALGEDHPDTATGYNNVAYNLLAQGRYAEAQPLFQKALDICRKVLGEDHPHTAQSYDNVAHILHAEGKYAQAKPLSQKALDIYRKALGEDHPDTAQSYNNVAANLYAQGKYAEAQPLCQKALDLRRKALGEDHPDTARSYSNLAGNLDAQGKYAAAESLWGRAADSFAAARLRLAASGLGRAAKTGEDSPLPRLAAVLARNGKPAEAWRRYEESLGRGTWDDLAARLRRPAAEQARQAELVSRLDRLDRLIANTFSPRQAAADQEKRREDLLGQRLQVAQELDAFARRLEEQFGPAAGRVFDRATIQAALPADAALVGWLDLPGHPKAADPDGEHWAMLLRSSGRAAWERLRGAGPNGSWTEADTDLPARLRAAVQAAGGDWRPLAQRLRAQRLGPLAKHLAAGGGLPAVRRLVVLPSPPLKGVPLEVLADGYTVSYATSGTLYAHLRQQPRPLSRGLLALADPVFDRPAAAGSPLAPLPPGGVLLTAVVPGGNAAQAGLKPNDVLLRYNGADLSGPADLKLLPDSDDPAAQVAVTFWRDGKTLQRQLRPGELGVAVAKEPAPAALAERRKTDRLLAAVRSGDDGTWEQLPGTRAEAEAIRRLFAGTEPEPLLLTDSQASEQRLDELAGQGALGTYRYLHLATHGEVDDAFPLRSAVILARDDLPDPDKQLEAGKPVYDGRLTAEEVLRRWNLHSELVTLSACQTALGKYEHGEGFVGFAQALLLAGSRAVCLSLWKVDDAATALLMTRFYQNLLGKRDGLKGPLGKAAALAEAKAWLRGLRRDEAVQQAARLTDGVERAKGRKRLPLLPGVPPAPAAVEDKDSRPYAHPHYWAAFVLIGDPD